MRTTKAQISLCILDSIISILAVSKITRLQLHVASVAEQACLSHTWLEILKTRDEAQLYSEAILLTNLEFVFQNEQNRYTELLGKDIQCTCDQSQHRNQGRYGIFEPRHEKTCVCHIRTTKTPIYVLVIHCLVSMIPLVSVSKISSL